MTYAKPRHNIKNLTCTACSMIYASVLLTACSDSATIGTGGGAGDSTDDGNEAIELITPLVGFFNLPSNWAGFPESNAIFQVQSPDDSGEAEALIYRIDSNQNCIETTPSTGEITKDLFSERLFLDDIFELENAVVSLTGSTLEISLPADVQDIDDDGDFDEPAVIQAPRLGIALITDAGEFCQ